MMYLLDTDICIDVLRQRSGMIEKLRPIAPSECAVSMVTVYELFCGLAKALDKEKEREKVRRFVSSVVELQFDRASAESAADIRSDLERQGMIIGPYDLLIAGQALSAGLVLVTRNIQEFARIRGLKVEQWP